MVSLNADDATAFKETKSAKLACGWDKICGKEPLYNALLFTLRSTHNSQREDGSSICLVYGFPSWVSVHDVQMSVFNMSSLVSNEVFTSLLIASRS